MQKQRENLRRSRIKRVGLLVASFILISFTSNLSYAKRFGINTGIYNDHLKTNCASSREIGLKLGFYIDDTVHDLVRKDAENNRINSLSSCDSSSQLRPVVRQNCSTPCQQESPSFRNCNFQHSPNPVFRESISPSYQQQLAPAVINTASLVQPANQMPIMTNMIPYYFAPHPVTAIPAFPIPVSVTPANYGMGIFAPTNSPIAQPIINAIPDTRMIY